MSDITGISNTCHDIDRAKVLIDETIDFLKSIESPDIFVGDFYDKLNDCKEILEELRSDNANLREKAIEYHQKAEELESERR